jgi:hypothetical protein
MWYDSPSITMTGGGVADERTALKQQPRTGEQRAWTFVRSNALAIVLAIVPPLAIWVFLERDRRSVEVALVQHDPVVAIDERYARGLELRFNKRSIQSLTAIAVRVTNTGNRPIQRSDYEDPMTLAYLGALIGEPQTSARRPAELRPVVSRVTNEPARARVEPLLLNPDDSFTVTALVADAHPSSTPVEVSGRIVGVSALRLVDGQERKWPWTGFLETLAAAFAASLSVGSVTALVRRVRRYFDVRSAAADAAIRIETLKRESPDSLRSTSDLARELGVTQHPVKGNVLLLRLRLEEELRALANVAGLGADGKPKSFSWLARQLNQREVIHGELRAAVEDLAPVLNREMHEIRSYLEPQEYAAVEALALATIAELSNIRQGRLTSPHAVTVSR